MVVREVTMSKQKMYEFIDENKDMQNLIELILNEKGLVEISFDKGKIKRKTKKIDF